MGSSSFGFVPAMPHALARIHHELLSQFFTKMHSCFQVVKDGVRTVSRRHRHASVIRLMHEMFRFWAAWLTVKTVGLQVAPVWLMLSAGEIKSGSDGLWSRRGVVSNFRGGLGRMERQFSIKTWKLLRCGGVATCVPSLAAKSLHEGGPWCLPIRADREKLEASLEDAAAQTLPMCNKRRRKSLLCS